MLSTLYPVCVGEDVINFGVNLMNDWFFSPLIVHFVNNCSGLFLSRRQTIEFNKVDHGRNKVTAGGMDVATSGSWYKHQGAGANS